MTSYLPFNLDSVTCFGVGHGYGISYKGLQGPDIHTPKHQKKSENFKRKQTLKMVLYKYL